MKDYEQIISTLLTKIAELEQVVEQQAAKIADLERRLNKHSSNSSKPPFSDGLGKLPRTTSLMERFISIDMLEAELLPGDPSRKKTRSG